MASEATTGARPQRAYLWYQIRGSFWFLPAIFLLGALCLSLLTLLFDRGPIGELIRDGSWAYKVGPEGARLVLSTVAGSMITVTSLVFSLTLVTLTLASQQLGPRVITYFMEDRVNQSVLGIFLATFVYALMILRTINDEGGTTFVPYGSIIVAIVLAVACFALLIYFIHHAALSIQADHILARVGDGLPAIIEDLFPPAEAASCGYERASLAKDSFFSDARPVNAINSGYIQLVAQEELLTLAEKRDLTVVVQCRAGHFVMAPLPLAWVGPEAAASDEVVEVVRNAIVVGPRRTATQDVEYTMRALVDITMRALSPSLNDPHTAMAGIDRIGDAVARLMRRGVPDPVLCDAEGRPRVALYPLSFSRIMRTAFQQIYEAARDNATVCLHLLETLTSLVRVACHADQRETLRQHGEEVAAMLREAVRHEHDRDRVKARWAEFERALEAPDRPTLIAVPDEEA